MLTRLLLIILIGLPLFMGIQLPDALQQSVEQDLGIKQEPPDPFSVEFFPDAPYHVGDVLSIRVSYHGHQDISGQEVLLTLENSPDEILAAKTFQQYSNQVVFYWILDTANFKAEYINFKFELPDINTFWTAGVNLLPSPPSRNTAWAISESECCMLHYLTGTDAENDLLTIEQVLQAQTQKALNRLAPNDSSSEGALDEPINLVLIPIIVGHGGFATNTAVLTYSERNWAGIEFDILSHHEIVHVLDRRFNQGPRPALFSEGMAVYLSGGHYRTGDALLRAAALLDMGDYIPLKNFIDNFYQAQHEISYMQAAGLVAYLTEIWGWEIFREFYYNLPEGDSATSIIETALNNQFNTSLAELEDDFIGHLKTLNPDEQIKEDVRLTIAVYDMLRRYQSIAIPSAHFQTAWWPPIDQMLESGIVGDYATREKSPFNVLIESLFLEMHAGLNQQDYDIVRENLKKIDQYLTKVEAGNNPLSHYTIGWPLPDMLKIPLKP